jgi:hypothetical protein
MTELAAQHGYPMQQRPCWFDEVSGWPVAGFRCDGVKGLRLRGGEATAHGSGR